MPAEKPIIGSNNNDNLPTAEALFGDQPAIQVASDFTSSPKMGRHIALVPVVEQGTVIAYLRLELSNQRIGNAYQKMANRFANFALVGIAAILVLGGLLYLQLSQIGSELVDLMKSGKPGVPRKRFLGADEFDALRSEAFHLTSENLKARSALDTLSQAMKVGVALFDDSGHERFVSQNARDLLEINTEKGFEDSLGETWATIQNTLKKLKQSEKSTAVLRSKIGHSDTARQLEFEFFRIVDDHGLTVVLVRNQDHVAALETSLRAATRMHTLSSIYMGAAHDLRAPISAMVMNLELLEESISENSANTANEEIDEQRRYVKILGEELSRLQRFLTSFLDNATTTRNTSREKVNLVTVVEELLGLFRIRARMSEVKLETQLPENSVLVDGSSDQLRQMLMNIIVNGIEAMPDGGVLRTEMSTNDGFVTLSFSDTGQGIPSAVLDRIFDLHFTTKDSGTGIGLHVARTIARQHGGDIDVVSDLGHGTSFTLTLAGAEAA